MSEKYEAVIGLEIHAELLTRSKMFCGCQVVDSGEARPNTAVCPVCLGLPGALPVLNSRAVDFAIRVALALNCQVQAHNIFARKNYFYPDLPKSYQISQYELPLGLAGWLDIGDSDQGGRRIRIRRVHMEEDTGKLTHLEGGGTLIDFNRSGVPLLEIVSEPDLRSGAEARLFASQIRQILRYLAVSSGDMEKGVFRVEPNISLRPHGRRQLGTRTELKNLNSFRSLADGTDYELARQEAILEAGGAVEQETRGWHDTRRLTFSQRRKEEADDYRYFAEPDLPPLQVDLAWIESVRAELPELPQARLARYHSTYALSTYDAGVLAEDREVGDWFDAAVAAGGDPKSVANWIINDLFRLMNERQAAIGAIAVTPAALVALVDLVDHGVISQNMAREVLAEMMASGRQPAEIVAERDLAQISDEAALSAQIAQVLADNPGPVADYLGGKSQLRGWFVGQVMRATGGKANPQLANELLARQLVALGGDDP